MSETQYAYRIPPCAKYDIAGMESWLEDLAAQGLFLERDGLFLGIATFVRGEPETLRFRLEATDRPGGLFSPTHDPEEDVLDLHYRMGWNYRGRWWQFFIYTTADPEAPELHTDPRVQALTIQALNKFQRTQLLSFFVYCAILYFFHGSVLFTLTALWGLGKTLVLLGFLLSFPVLQAVALVRMAKLKRRLKQGIPMTHRSDYKARSRAVYTGRALRWCAGILLFCSFMGIFSQAVLEETAVELKDWTSPLPFPLAEELYPGAEITEGGFIRNQVTPWSNWLCPVNYDVVEWSDIRYPDGQKTTAYLRVYYHESRWEWFARGLALEYASQRSGAFADLLFTDARAPVALDGVDADYAVSVTQGSTHNQGIVIREGNRVILVMYSREVAGYFSPEELATAFLAASH